MARRQKYKFAKKEYAKKGKLSAGIALASLLLFLASVIISFAFHGMAGVLVGGMILLAMLLSVFGFFLGVRGYSEKGCYHTFCTVGSISNGLLCFLYLALFSIGVS